MFNIVVFIYIYRNIAGFIVTVIHERKYSGWTNYRIFNVKECGM